MFFRKCIFSALVAFALAAFAPPPQARAQDDKNAQPAEPRPTPSAAQQDEEAVERVDVDLTNVFLNVVDRKRRFVTTLKPEDIRVLEDGVEQQVFTFQRETDLPLSLAVLLDTSASQAGVLKDEQEAARAFVAHVLRPEKDNAAIVSFTGLTRIEQPLSGDPAALNAAIERVKVEFTDKSPECENGDTPDEIKIRCYTAAWDAVAIAVREVLARTPESTRRAIILLSDGDDTRSRLRVYHAVEHAVKNNTVVYAIGIRDEKVDEGELRRDHLRQISEETGGRAFFPKNRQELDAAFAQINQELRSQYLLAYSPSNKRRDGSFRRVTVEVTNPALRKEKLKLLYRQGYFARKSDEPKTPPLLESQHRR